MTPNTNCAVCEQPFYGSPGHLAKGWARFCSMGCRSVAKSGSGNGRWSADGESVCAGCGKAFHRKPSQKAAEKFCSISCRRKAKSVDAVCVGCGTPYRAYLCHASRRRYCSRACERKARTPQWNRACESCGKWFYVKPADLKRGDKVRVGSFCSRVCKTRGMTQRWKPAGGKRARSGKRADLGDRYFRSSWEANYARYLNWLQSLGEIDSWEYEVDTFEFPVKRGSKFYTPDFKVRERGSICYHEVKGWMDQRSATKLKRMTKYYPTVRVVLIDRPHYSAIAKKAAGMVAGWE